MHLTKAEQKSIAWYDIFFFNKYIRLIARVNAAYLFLDGKFEQ